MMEDYGSAKNNPTLLGFAGLLHLGLPATRGPRLVIEKEIFPLKYGVN